MSFSLDNVLQSNQPSSLDLLARHRQNSQRNRLQLGSARSNLVGNPVANAVQHEFAKEKYNIDYSKNPTQVPDKAATPANLPPLEPTVGRLKENPRNNETSLSLAADFSAENEESTMTIPKTVDSAIGTAKTEGRNHVKIPKSSWEKILDHIDKADKKYVDECKANCDIRAILLKREEEIRALQGKLTKKNKNSKKPCRKDEAKEDVQNAIIEYVKLVLFRTVKFAPPGEALDNACLKVWNGIKDNLKLEEGPNAITLDDFTPIYSATVQSALSARRQYVQTRAGTAAQEWFDNHGDTLPTIEQIENIWNIEMDLPENASAEEKAKFEQEAELLTWYLDNFLEKCVGLEYWGPTIRPFELLTSMKPIEGDPSCTTPKVLVTVTSEAFAQVIYKNCRDKWLADFQYQKGKTGKARNVPKYKKEDPSTHKYQNRWSNSRTGAVSGGGWAEEAMDYLNERITAVQEMRAEEVANGNKRLTFGQDLIKTANSIALTAAEQSTKKRKEGTKAAEKAKKVPKIIVLDE